MRQAWTRLRCPHQLLLPGRFPCRRFYQHLPGSAVWGFNLVWGHATSKVRLPKPHTPALHLLSAELQLAPAAPCHICIPARLACLAFSVCSCMWGTRICQPLDLQMLPAAACFHSLLNR